MNFIHNITKNFDGRPCHTYEKKSGKYNKFSSSSTLPIYNKQIRILINTFCNRSQKQQFNICLLHYNAVYKLQSILHQHMYEVGSGMKMLVITRCFNLNVRL